MNTIYTYYYEENNVDIMDVKSLNLDIKRHSYRNTLEKLNHQERTI